MHPVLMVLAALLLVFVVEEFIDLVLYLIGGRG